MLAAVPALFGADGRAAVPIPWLSDNGSVFTALDTVITAERLHVFPITTPASSHQCNGMSAALVNTLRRDYLAGTDRLTAVVVLAHVPAVAHYNAVAPHSTLRCQSRQRYRRGRATTADMC